MKKLLVVLGLMIFTMNLAAQKTYELNSPDGRLTAVVEVGSTVQYSVSHDGVTVLAPSTISMDLGRGKSFGIGSKVKSVKTSSIDRTIEARFYKKKLISDRYNELTLVFREDFSIIFRAYDEAIAYRFVSTCRSGITVYGEQAEFNFAADHNVYVPYVKGKHENIESQYFNSFENTYTYCPLSGMNTERLAFTPLVVELDGGRKVCIAESDLESYPGMFLVNSDGSTSLRSVFAPYPKTLEQGGHNQLQMVVTAREPYLATCEAGAYFPWRIVLVTTEDIQLADNDMVYRLASPSRIDDLSWIKPGRVAWEWWNHWGLSGVGFEAGVNNETYMAYIDFASEHGIEYVILDEGWAVKFEADLFKVVPEIDLEKLVAYARSKNVDLILWAGYYAFDRDMEEVCRRYSQMGIKGFKIDFMDRDDQQMVDFHYRAAETAARHKLLVDFHGTYKPTGLNRTYPNVINFEGVHGLEQMKWSDINTDQVAYDVTMPFIRMVAGPVDYTQGAMRNATKRTYRAINDEPMSQGTRCRQLAAYVVFESPLNMLCDSPANYYREPECTRFIADIPTVWDKTVAVNGEIGKYITMARRSEDIWYAGGMTDWDEREIELDLSFLGPGSFSAEIYTDGANANRIASDYRKETVDIPEGRKMKITMAEGGGFAMKITKN